MNDMRNEVKNRTSRLLSVAGVLGVMVSGGLVLAEDWPMWGRNETRNMVSPAKNIPHDFDPGQFKGLTEEIDPTTTRNIKWIAKLGSQAYGNPTVAGGKVFVGTNNESPRDPKYKGDRSAVYALDEKTGELVWQFNVRKLGSAKVGDWEFLGICSSPAVAGNRVYFVNNLCHVVCLDIDGLRNGNDGPFKDEATYFAELGKPPIELSETDADIIWVFDMSRELGVFPHNITSSSVLVKDGAVYVTTSNGVDWSHVDIINKQAPTLIKLDAATGELLAEEASGISERLYHANWSSPAFATVNGREMVIFGAGDGYVYGFATEPVMKEIDGEEVPVFKEYFRYDCNLPHYKVDEKGQPRRYASGPGPSEVIATPVVYNGKIYVGIGQDPEHGEGVGAFHCIDPTKTGDISQSGRVWMFDQINRSISTASIVDGLVFIADYSGFVYCLDAETGELYWKHDTYGHIWGSTLVVDGKVYLGNEDGLLTIFAASREKKIINEIEFPGPIYSTPVVANGVLYIATHTHLYAIAEE